VPELARFFGVIIRMYAAVLIIGRTFTLTTSRGRYLWY